MGERATRYRRADGNPPLDVRGERFWTSDLYVVLSRGHQASRVDEGRTSRSLSGRVSELLAGEALRRNRHDIRNLMLADREEQGDVLAHSPVERVHRFCGRTGVYPAGLSLP
jgi:hypothetical protein